MYPVDLGCGYFDEPLILLYQNYNKQTKIKRPNEDDHK